MSLKGVGMMNNVNVLFLNNKAMRELGATDMEKVMNDVEMFIL